MTDNASELIPVKSPLALTGVFLDVLRERFNPKYDLGWSWLPGDEGRAGSTIHIEAGGNRHTEDYSRRPAIYVIRNPINYSQAVLGDRYVNRDKTGDQFFYCIAQTGFTINIEAEESGEAEMLADIVLSTLMMGSDEIERFFLFKKLGPFALSSEIRLRQDTEVYMISVQFGLSYEVRWATYPIRPLLKEILVKVRDGTYTNNDNYFITIYQESLAQKPQMTP